ncbi:MAG: alanine racemase [Peptococcaceae bacterium]|nr:alanine racemase [Peptococcaceae bacterium]
MSDFSQELPRAWVEVDMKAVRQNYDQVMVLKSPHARCMAVVKADGYGLGSEILAKTLAQAGCDAFAVTTVEQGVGLRRRGVDGLILVLGPALSHEWGDAVEHDLTLTVSRGAALEELEKFCAAHGRSVDIHLEIETGMGRTGFSLQDLREASAVLSELSHVKVAGVYTHFAQAMLKKGRAYTLRQFERFCEGVDFLKGSGISPGICHVCNSAAFLAFPEFHLDMVRIGTLLIGHLPAPHLGEYVKLTDPWSAKARVLQVKRVPSGTYVGYQSLYKTRGETQLAVIGLGYADGFNVEPKMAPQGWVDLAKIIVKNLCALLGISLRGSTEAASVEGRPVRVAGKVGMELTVLDVGLEACTVGQVVTVPLRRTVASARLERVYVEEGYRVLIRQVREHWEDGESGEGIYGDS